jgi:hypothetical protein
MTQDLRGFIRVAGPETSQRGKRRHLITSESQEPKNGGAAPFDTIRRQVTHILMVQAQGSELQQHGSIALDYANRVLHSPRM